MRFKPTVDQLCSIADMTVARMTQDFIANRIGVPVDEFRAWRFKMMAATPADDAIIAARPMPTASQGFGSKRRSQDIRHGVTADGKVNLLDSRKLHSLRGMDWASCRDAGNAGANRDAVAGATVRVVAPSSRIVAERVIESEIHGQ